jgi:hypothetical protein
MACLDDTWIVINAKGIHLELVRNVKRELFMCMALVPLLHTFLGAPIGRDITVSDASNTGGAVGISTELTQKDKTLQLPCFLIWPQGEYQFWWYLYLTALGVH